MSAATVEHDLSAVAEAKAHPKLSVVERPQSTVSVLGFALMILALVIAGLAIVMVVTTSVAQQSRELAKLTTQSTELGYQAASLTTELQQRSSAPSLALQASRLGMAPNPYPAFISLKDGSVLGEPVPVKGDELSFLTTVTPDAPLPGALTPALPEVDG